MASINGVSIKNLKIQKVDFNMFPNAETDTISSGDIYIKGKAICHFADDINGGPMNINSIGKGHSYREIEPAYYRWLSAVADRKYVEMESFIYDITSLMDLEKFFVKANKQEEYTLFASLPLNGYGIIKGYVEKGAKNLTEKKKADLESQVFQELQKYGSSKPVNCYTKAFRKVSDFDIIVGDEKEGKRLLQEEIDRRNKLIDERLQAEKARKEQENEKEKISKISAHFNRIEIPNEPFIFIEDNRTGKKSKVPLFALNEVVKVLKELDL